MRFLLSLDYNFVSLYMDVLVRDVRSEVWILEANVGGYRVSVVFENLVSPLFLSPYDRSVCTHWPTSDVFGEDLVTERIADPSISRLAKPGKARAQAED